MVMGSGFGPYRSPSGPDRKAMLAQLLLQQSQNKQATTPIGGIDKIASMALAGLMMGQGMQEQKDNEAFDQKTMAEAMKQMTPQTVQGEAPGPMMDGSAGYQMDRVVPGDVNRGMQTLAQSPRLAGMAQQQMLANLLKGEERAANRKDQMDLYNMQDQDRWTQLRTKRDWDQTDAKQTREQAMADRQEAYRQQERLARLQASLREPRQDPLTQVADPTTGGPVLMPQSKAAGQVPYLAPTNVREPVVKIRGEDGRPVFVPQSKAVGLEAYETPKDQRLSPTQEKELFEADDNVQSGISALGTLEKALSLSGTAYEGGTADLKAWAARNTPFFNDEKGAATTQLDAMVKDQALSQLKSIFGAAPTEGERKLLLDIQGATTMSKAEREALLSRAADMTQRRVEFNRAKAGALRGGTYLKEGVPPQPQQPQQPPGIKFLGIE